MADGDLSDSGSNPFRKALEPLAEGELVSRERPFRREIETPNARKVEHTRTIAELGLVDRGALERTPKIRDLTVHDLNDLADEFSGIPTSNAKVADLTIEDIQDIEAVFMDFKLGAARELSSRLAKNPAASVDVSCCCCTPCCCCAATDMSHTA